MRSAFLCILLLSVFASAGCANLNSIFHRFDATTSVSIDAFQRVVLVGNKRSQTGGKIRAFCAEPSPDAFSVASSALALEADTPQQISARLAGSLSESGSSIGLRTQTIQLLRDSMYRLCEGFISGALNSNTFFRLQRRYQSSMVSLLAIEQLTGATVARQVILTSSSESSVGKELLEVQKNLDNARAASKAAQDDLKLKTAASDKAKTAATKARELANNADTGTKVAKEAEAKTLEEKATETNEAKVASAKAAAEKAENVKSVEELRHAAAAPGAKTTAGGSFASIAPPSPPSSESIASIANAVESITRAFVNGEAVESCFQYLAVTPKTDTGSVLLTACEAILKREAESANAETRALMAR